MSEENTPVTPKSSKKDRIPMPITLPEQPEITNVVTITEFNDNLDSLEEDLDMFEARLAHLEHHMDTEDPEFKKSRPGIVNKIQVKLLNNHAKMPTIAKSGDAAMDLFASESTTIPATISKRVIAGGIVPDASINLVVVEKEIPAILNRKLVPTGISMSIPVGYYGRVAPRSGLSCKGFDVGAGVIDAGYRGEIKVLMINNSGEDKVFHQGDKFAQLILTKIMDKPILEEVEELSISERGAGGFGSTGEK